MEYFTLWKKYTRIFSEIKLYWCYSEIVILECFKTSRKATVVESFDFTKEDFIKKSLFLRTKLNLLLLILSEYKRIK